MATTFVTSVITIVTPFLAQAGYGWIFASRIVMGFCHGVTFPLLQGCWSVWAPPMETSNLIAIYTAGNSVGTCLIFPLGGLLAGSSLGWQSIFYFTGGSGILWCICWAFLVYDSPSQHPRISQEEKVTPFLAQAGYGWIFASRIVMGFCHGVTFPLLQGCWSVWAPPMETSNLIAIYTAGNSVGTCLIFPLGGLLAGSSLGWQSIFYFTGGSGILWCICWAFLVYDSPSQHPRISQEEKVYIESSIQAQQQHTKSSLGNEKEETKAIPWKAMLTSKVVWSVAIAHLASNWGVYQMNSLLPTYLNDVLQ